MCGLAGIAGNTTAKLRDGFLDLLTVTQLRGRDATGAFVVRNGNETVFAKTLGTPEWLFDLKSFDSLVRGVPKIMAGHCRSKTIGENTVRNAHPYDFENLIGMHNGTLRAYYNMDGYDHKLTDSHCLYHNIDRRGVEETVRDLDPDGAWALVWWDKVENTLNFLRNDKRPLWFAWTKERTAMIWASEPWMFSAVSRHVELWDGSEEGSENKKSPYFQLPPDTWWSFTVNDFPKAGEKHLTFRQPREVKAEGKKPLGFLTNRWREDGGGNGGEVANPFSARSEDAIVRFHQRQAEKFQKEKLNDPVDDVAAEESTTTKDTSKKVKTNSSNVLDFRRGLMNSTNSRESIPSQRLTSSPLSLPKPKEPSTSFCEDYTSTARASHHSLPRVTVRDILGTEYIADKVTGSEMTAGEFEARTGAVCSCCKKPIGDLKEVSAFLDKSLSRFICVTCTTQPEIPLIEKR